MSEILLDGRIVSGHPMARNAVKDDNGVQKTNIAGEPMFEFYFALAVPKTGTTDWKQTDWGQTLHTVAAAGWPNGEYNAPTFAWKVTDGDSMIPNKRGKKPAEREGWAGHWVVHMSTSFPIGCFHSGKYQPHETIQNDKEFKCGDYVKVHAIVKDNAPSQSPGIYINPDLVSVERAGEAIVGNRPDAAAVFGRGAPAQQPASPPAPAHDLVNNPGGAASPPPPAPAEASYKMPDGSVHLESDL